MPSEDSIIDQYKDLDFDPEFDLLFYSAGLDDCFFDESEELSLFFQVGDQDMWRDHSANDCNISFCGGMIRAWKEGKSEISGLQTNLRNMLKKSDGEVVSKLDIIYLFYGKGSVCYRAYHEKLRCSNTNFLMF